MEHDDLDDLVAWRSSPGVRRRWSESELTDHDAMRDKYVKRIDGRSPTRMWVIEVNGRSAGFVQDHRIGDYPVSAALPPDPHAIGVDDAIAVDRWRGRGLGQRVLWAWMMQARAHHPEAASYVAAPDHRDGASLRILAKAGFQQRPSFDEPQSDGSTTTVIGCTLNVVRVMG